jgi:hypothetical protein
MIFTDNKGRKWSKENLQDLIDGFEHYKKFQQMKEHYFPDDFSE